FERVRAGRAGTEVWARATFGLAGVEKDAHHYEAARALYREVEAAAPSAETVKAAREYAAIMDKHIARRGALYGFAALMFAAAIVLATRIPWTRLTGEDLRSPRAELLLAGPLLAILVALAWGELPYVRWSVVLIALSALSALALNALYLRTNPPKGAFAIAYPFLAAAVAFGAIYAIFYAQDLVFVIEDTIKYGWD
ncbi:MAG: hypothetical protein K8I02_12355, partial [Candidatus Methylomirabilis sp.]|nr:hypothetical protein [Deltaproteobacteria bacterium]